MLIQKFSPKRNRMNIWLFIYYYLITLIFLINKIGSVNKKLQRSFDEIFREGWEEKGQMAEENLEDGQRNQDGIGQYRTKVLQKDKNNKLNQINEEGQTDQNESDNKNADQSGKTEFGMGKQKTNSNDYSDQQKREIIRKFRAIKEKMKQRGIKCSRKEWNKIDYIIAKKLGANQKEIYKWIREFDMGIKSKNEFYSIYQKIEKVQQFMTMTNEYKQKRTYSNKEWQQNYTEISKKIGVGHGTIQKWKKEIGMAPKTTDQQKREIIHKFHLIKQKIKQKGIKCSGKETKKLGTNRSDIYKWIKELGMGSRIIDESKRYELVQKFIAMSNEYKQKRTYSKKEWAQNYAEISKKIGVSYTTIQKWKKEIGMTREQKSYSNEEKLETMKQFWEMKRNMPNISERKIIETLQINGRSIRRWKTEFEKNEFSKEFL